ncbi:hypothetical protein NP493_109g05004 [Ridgeia piscesae]|uniref:UBC core domain-containing protein n=1 Tax=Ridgeia piscesae TaxID=27915 RepID=A0AAD9UH93_RIDPI|nr:hypothetical protein NP493_109g05004 [Ridgeia piscesae]
MHSRAHLIIHKQFQMLKKEGLWGITAEQMYETNMFEWIVKMKPLKGSSWAGGEFTVYLKFDEYYNEKPPQVFFYTIPFHPNIDPVTGRPCVDFLDEQKEWSPSYSVSYILLVLQVLLDRPVLENAVNMEALTLLLTQPEDYNNIIHHCVTASLNTAAPSLSGQSDGASTPGPGRQKPASLPPATKPLSTSLIRKLSFEDYHATWRQIATSKTVSNLSEIDEREPGTGRQSMYDVRASQVDQSTKQDPFFQSESIEKELKYGRFDTKPLMKQPKESQFDRIQRMKKLYLQPRNTPRKITSAGSFFREDRKIAPGFEKMEDGEDMFEEEEKDLVAWTNSLNEDTI